MNKFRQYKLENLECWQKARNYRKEIYKIASKFPYHVYKLKGQIIGSAGSVGNNIAEGFGRGHFQENIHFCRIARGSLLENRDQLYESFDYELISKETFQQLYDVNINLEQSINSHIAFLKNKKKECC